MIHYTHEQRAFLLEYLPKHTHAETVDAFNERFPDNPMTISQSHSFACNNKTRSCNNGKFEKGHKAHNKGKKWDDYMSIESQIKSRKTCFKNGHMMNKRRPVGSKRLTKDDYIEVKIAEPNKWKLMHIHIWEQHNGPVPKGNKIIFKDDNKYNFDINNLMMVTSAELLKLNQFGWKTEHGDVTEAYVNLIRLNNARRSKNNAQCTNEKRQN